MAEEQAGAAEEQSGGGRGVLKLVGILVGVALVAAIAGLAVFNFVLRPMLAEQTTDEDGTIELIPLTAVTVPFDESFANIKTSDPNLPPALLWYKVNLECADEGTAVLVEKYKAHFSDMLMDLHSYHTREDLEEPLVKESIKKKALLEANQILKQCPEKPDPAARIISVFYDKFLITEQ